MAGGRAGEASSVSPQPLPSAGVTASAPPQTLRHEILVGARSPVPQSLGTAAVGDSPARAAGRPWIKLVVSYRPFPSVAWISPRTPQTVCVSSAPVLEVPRAACAGSFRGV